MKRVIHRIQALGDKAAQLKQVVEGAPAVAAGIRDAVTVTAGQLQQLRADVQTGVSGLRVEDEERLLTSLREISASTEVFEQAGFSLGGVDIELGLLRRIVVRFKRTQEGSVTRLRSLHASTAGRPTVQALLNAFVKAEEMAGKVSLPDLSYRELIVDVGPVPTVRVCWRSEEWTVVDESPQATPVTAVPTVPPVLATTPSILGKDSFFEPRPAARSPIAAESPAAIGILPAATAPVASNVATAPVSSVPQKSPTDWKRGVLDRFKRMPDLSKSGH